MDVSLSNALTATSIRPGKPEPADSRGSDVQAAQANEGLVNEGLVAEQPLEQAVSSIEGFVQKITRDLNFSLDDSTGRMVVKVTDRASGDVVRQIPSEEALRLAENLEQVRSLLFKAEA